MKHIVYVIFIMLFVFKDVNGQVFRIRTDSLPSMHFPELNPGFFYNNTTNLGNVIFDSSGFYCNSLRLTDTEWYLRSSTSFSQALSKIKSLKTFYQKRASFTDKIIIMIGGMPFWLSSSTNNNITCGNWHYYQTVKPSSYKLWDSLVGSIATEISSWGINPHYEIWNEPDLTCYWNGTETELIELYRHTVQAIKDADPNAKVGGLAVNGWYKGISSPYNNVAGNIPDTLADKSSLLAHLIDSCASYNIPLDFITFHFFAIYKGMIGNAMNYFKNKLTISGFPNAEIFITEYNSASIYREKSIHSSFILNCYDEFRKHHVLYHDMAALQDFTLNTSHEFFNDVGSISRSGIIKPIYNTLYLLNKVRSSGGRLPVDKPNEIFGLASQNYDTLRLLIANHVPSPIYGGRNELFFGSSPINTIDLTLAGYLNWTQVDETIAGHQTPFGPPNVVEAFHNANKYFLWAFANFQTPDTLDFRFVGWSGIKQGRTCLLDDSTNNSIFIYDSLISAGKTNSWAVMYLLANQMLTFNNIFITDSILPVILKPNSVLYVEIYGAPGTAIDPGLPTELPEGLILNQNFPNPFSHLTEISFYIPNQSLITLRVYDLFGREVATLINGQVDAGQHSVIWDARGVESGIYIYRLESEQYNATKMMVLKH